VIPRSDTPQRYLDLHAVCHQAFTPFAPITLPDFFAGRLDVVRSVISELSAPGRQVAIFGERGVGKTSLAELLGFFTEFPPDRVRIYRCGAEDTFDTIFADLLSAAGAGLTVDTVERERGLKGGARWTFAEMGGERRSRTVLRSLLAGTTVSKSRVLETFADAETLLIVDEYDRIDDPRTHTRVAELIKAFSDSRSTSKIVIIGVAETLTELVGEHASLSRSLAQIRLDRMSDAELADIVRRGEQRTSIEFPEPVVHRIVRLADGFPHFVHLVALHSALETIDRLRNGAAPDRLRVDEASYAAGVSEAIRRSEHTLSQGYEDAVVSTRRPTHVYELILQAIAMGDSAVAQVRDIARHASTLAGREYQPSQLSNALGRLIRDEKGEILTKVRDGYYKFTNPLMRAYVRLLLDERYRGQLRLPFFD